MNFSKVPYKSLLGKALRFPLKLIPSDTVMPILQGRLKGKKWIAGSHTHGCWLGSYEYKERILFEKIVKKGSVVFDIGAHCGFYTLLASELVGPEGKVFAFEPFPKNINYLKEHIRLNNLSNVVVIEAAVSDIYGRSCFGLDANASSSEGHLGVEGGIIVKTVSLDELVDKKEIPDPDYIKIDVEGAELSVLSGARRLVERKHPVLFVSTHGQNEYEGVVKLLGSFGYKLETLRGPDIGDVVFAHFL